MPAVFATASEGTPGSTDWIAAPSATPANGTDRGPPRGRVLLPAGEEPDGKKPEQVDERGQGVRHPAEKVAELGARQVRIRRGAGR